MIQKIKVALTWLEKASATCGKVALASTATGAAIKAVVEAVRSIVSLLDAGKEQ